MKSDIETGRSAGAHAQQGRRARLAPEPVGAPSNTFSSVWYNVWNACVCKRSHKKKGLNGAFMSYRGEL